MKDSKIMFQSYITGSRVLRNCSSVLILGKEDNLSNSTS